MRKIVEMPPGAYALATGEIVIGISEHTTAGYLTVITELEFAHPGRVRCHQHSALSDAGETIREGIALMCSLWERSMVADPETHPGTTGTMMAQAVRDDIDIVAALRGLPRERFGDYPQAKRVCNRLFHRQRVARAVRTPRNDPPTCFPFARGYGVGGCARWCIRELEPSRPRGSLAWRNGRRAARDARAGGSYC